MDVSTLLLVVATGAIVLTFVFSLIFKPASPSPLAAGTTTPTAGPAAMGSTPPPTPLKCTAELVRQGGPDGGPWPYTLTVHNIDPAGATVSWDAQGLAWTWAPDGKAADVPPDANQPTNVALSLAEKDIKRVQQPNKLVQLPVSAKSLLGNLTPPAQKITASC
jgi:hypothetical protein